MTENTLPKDGKGKFMPSRTASKPNQGGTATLDLIKGHTTHAVNVSVGDKIIEIIAAKAKKEKFIAKHPFELKITVIGHTTGRAIKDAIKELSLAQKYVLTAKVNDLVANTNFAWVYKLDDDHDPIFYKFRRDIPETVNRKGSKSKYTRRCRRWSIAIMVEVPGLAGFYQKLQNLLNEATGGNLVLDLPVPHITLYVKGKSLDGIGIESQKAFDSYRVKRF